MRAAKTESEAVGLVHPSGWGAMADRAGEALRGGDGASAVEPDAIGEALLLRVWGGVEGAAAVVRAAKERGRQVAASVVRTVQDFSAGDTPRQEPLQWFDALLAEGKKDLTLLRQLEGELPNQTLALRERASEVDRMLVEALREGGDGAALARALNNLGYRLGDLGRREEALSATEEAVRIYAATGQ